MIRAGRTLGVPRERVFEFLAHLPNHWRLHDSLLEVESSGEQSAVVALSGPFGVRREARTRVEHAEAPSMLRGVAEVGGTVARVGWDLEERGAGTHVVLWTEIERASRRDRLVLALGGRRWLRGVYARVLANLERELAAGR